MKGSRLAGSMLACWFPLFWNAEVNGQTRLAQPVPDLEIREIIRYHKGAAGLHEFNDGLLILDFWNTHCGACIAAMPKVDSIIHEFAGKLTVLHVTREAEATVRAMLGRNDRFSALTLPFVVSDSILSGYFAHRTVPHLVWIDKGRVIAVTDGSYLNRDNIRLALDGMPNTWPVKDDFAKLDLSKPALSGQVASYSVSVGGYIPGVGSKDGREPDSLAGTVRHYYLNHDLAVLYRKLLPMPSADFAMIPARIVIDHPSPENIMYQQRYGTRDTWLATNGHSIEAILPSAWSVGKSRMYMAEQLSAFTDTRATWTRRRIPCLILKRARGTPSPSHSKPGLSYRIKDIQLIFDMQGNNPPIVDETGFDGEVKLADWENLTELSELLEDAGFKIEAGERMLDVLLITRK